jgi:hypothetical protein
MQRPHHEYIQIKISRTNLARAWRVVWHAVAQTAAALVGSCQSFLFDQVARQNDS